MYSLHRKEAIGALAVILILLATGLTATAQSLSVQPVNILLAPDQMATSLTVTNLGDSETSIQIRAYAWSQKQDDDPLTDTDAVVVSPPIATIAPRSGQVVRLILRQPPQDREATYRILLDQIPPPAEPGVVHVVLRLSIPIFAQPTTRAVAHVQYHVELNAGKLYLVGINDGLRHEVLRDVVLSASDGPKLKPAPDASPYILAGAIRRWNIVAQGPLPQTGDSMRLTGRSDSGVIEQQVQVIAAP
jgi:fimbrial chaperone protein